MNQAALWRNFATPAAMFVYPVTFRRLGIENYFLCVYNTRSYIYIFIYIYIYIYIYELYVHEKWELSGSTYFVWRQFTFYFQQISLHKLFHCVSNAVNNCCREQYDERLDRTFRINILNAELNPICRLLALLGNHHMFHINRITVIPCQFIIIQHVWCENS